MKTVLSLSIMICIMFVCVSPAQAMKDRATEELIERAVVIASVRIISFEKSEQSGTGYYTVQIDECVKGSLTFNNMLIRVPRSYQPAQMVGDNRKLDIGQLATLYLETGPQGAEMSSIVLALVPKTNRIN